MTIFNYSSYFLNSFKGHYDGTNLLERFDIFPTFAFVQERHIFYTINRNNRKNWKTIDSNSGDTDNLDLHDVIGLIDEIRDEIQKLNEKFDRILSKK